MSDSVAILSNIRSKDPFLYSFFNSDYSSILVVFQWGASNVYQQFLAQITKLSFYFKIIIFTAFSSTDDLLLLQISIGVV